MKTDKLSVEIHESKRFNDKGIEMFRPSDQVRLVNTDEPVSRVDAGEARDFYNVYTGTVVMADVGDMSDTSKLGERVKTDLYPGDERSARECLVDVINNGGLRLAYGDLIKSQFKTGNGTGQKALIAASRWVWTQPELLPEFTRLMQSGEHKAADEFVLKAFAARPR